MTRIRHILVPTDFSEPAQAAWRYALMIAKQFNSRVRLLHVVTPPPAYDPWGMESVAMRLADLLAESEEAAAKHLKKLAQTKGALAGRISTATATGVTVDEILHCIADKHIDLVVMGTHGHGVVGQMLMGSVAQRVVQRSPVPVLTVHAPVQNAVRRARRRR